MGQPTFWLKGIHFVPFHRLKTVVVLKRNSFNNFLMLFCICLGFNYCNLNKEEKNSLGKTLSQSKLLLIETEVVSFTVKNPEQFFQ